MLKKLLSKNVFKTLIIALLLSLFLIIVFAVNHNNTITDEALNAFNSLPIWLRVIFMILIPIFGDFKYLYQFIMLYIIPITFIYSFYLGFTIDDENQIEETMPLARKTKRANYILAPFIHIVAILVLLFISAIITTSICYKSFQLELINGFISLLFWNTVVYAIAISFNKLNKKYKLILIISIVLYLSLAFIITSIASVSWFYYLSPLNILLLPKNSFLIYLLPLGIIISLSILYFMKKHKHIS